MPFVSNPHHDAQIVDHKRPAVEPGDAIEVDDETAESLLAQGWKRVKGKKSPEPSEEASPTPAESTADSGEQKE